MGEGSKFEIPGGTRVFKSVRVFLLASGTEAYHLGTRAIFQNTSDIKGYPIPNNNPPPQVAAKPAIEKGRELLQLMSSGGTLQKKGGEIIARITFDMTL